MKVALALCLLASWALVVRADLYMQNPPGCNDRNRERNQNRNNANRMFDSQNNAAGGYPWRGDPTKDSAPDPITYYHGSMLRLEWTLQHACGENQNVACQLIMQYGCEDDMPGLRDGYPEGTITESDNNNPGYKRRQFSGRGGQQDDGTGTIPTDRDTTFYEQAQLGGVEYGYHEGINYYRTCQSTTRNKGLYTSDQQLNGNDARFTRQNPNGGRRGLECAEERDYFPYWRPTPWHDLAVLVSDTRFCGYYQANSENRAPRSYCQCSQQCRNAAPNQLIPITQTACTTAGGTWVTQSRNEGSPDCRFHAFSRDNHLGNTAPVNEDGALVAEAHQPEMAHYNLAIPRSMGGATGTQLCVVRLRYNMSTNDYPAMAFALPGATGVGFTSAQNCPRVNQNQNPDGVDDGSGNSVANPQCNSALTINSRPLYNRPYVQMFDNTDPMLSLAINTHQTGRTFQDRSYVFRVAPKPDGVGTVWNLNLRGRRGNIVQAYPAVEYDFVPSHVDLGQGDWLHIQFHGSDFNAARNANNAEGWQYSDRTNMVQSEERQINYPLHKSQISLFDSVAIAKRFALLGQDLNPQLCTAFQNGDNNEQNDIRNCGKLNRAPNTYPSNPVLGLVQFNNPGTYHYFSTRNNNFSNRSQKATITVSGTGLSAAAVAGIVVGTLAGVGLLTAGVCFYGKRNPNSVAGGWYQRTVGRANCARGGSSSGGTGSTFATSTSSPPPPDMEYRRH